MQIAQDHKINQYSMILANYQRYFSDFYDAHPDQGMESTLIETRDLLRQHNALLDRFERTGVGLAESFT